MSRIEQAQAENDLRVRIYEAKGGFLRLGCTSYMPLIEIQAMRDGLEVDSMEKLKLRQVFNGRLSIDDEPRVALIERALAAQQAA